MLKSVKDFLDTLTGQTLADSPQTQERALKLACAVLLIEVMRSHSVMDASERQVIQATLKRQFGLTSEDSDQLLDVAAQTAKGANDYFRFTSVINDQYSHPQKIQIIESMWKVAYADGHIDANENHVISKVAGLLYVTHGEYIAAKLYAKEATAPAPN